MLRFDELPPAEIYTIKSSADRGGIGEVGVTTVGPALCKALAAAGYRPGAQPIK